MQEKMYEKRFLAAIWIQGLAIDRACFLCTIHNMWMSFYLSGVLVILSCL